MEDNWHISPIFERYVGGSAYALVTVLAVMLLLAWTISVFFTRISARRRAILACLRLLVILTLILVMLRPTRVYTELRKQSATLVLLIDRSRSMLVEDTANGQSRWQELRKALTDASESLKSLADEKELEINAYVFDGDVLPVDVAEGRIALDEQPVGEQSAYGLAMREVLRREDGKRLVGFVLLGDGAQQTIGVSSDNPEASARQLAQLGCALYTVPFGHPSGSNKVRDIAIESMPDDLSVFVRNQLTVTGTLRISGYANQDIPVQLVVETAPGKQEVVATKTYRASQDGEQLRFELGYVPEQPGEFKLLVRAVPQVGEVTTTNNELPTFLTVLDGGLRVLYLQGELRSEQRFLRRALAASPDIDVTLVTLHTRDRGNWPVTHLARHFKPGAYDVYIIGDVDATAFHPGDPSQKRSADLLQLKQAIERGSGLLMLGGWHSFRPGGYHNTPLADVLPVEMDAKIDRLVVQRFDQDIDRSLHIEGPLQMRPADPWGLRSDLMRLAPAEENLAKWLSLPPLSGANRFRGVKDGAQVLAEDQQGRPLLVSAEPAGRVLAFAGDSTWRWVMHGKDDAHRRFWRQAVLWLARKEDSSQGNVWIQLDGRRFSPGQHVTFRTGARTATGDALCRPESRSRYRALVSTRTSSSPTAVAGPCDWSARATNFTGPSVTLKHPDPISCRWKRTSAMPLSGRIPPSFWSMQRTAN